MSESSLIASIVGRHSTWRDVWKTEWRPPSPPDVGASSGSFSIIPSQKPCASRKFDVAGHDLADKEGFDLAREAWLTQMESRRDNVDVMANAAAFFKLPDKQLAVRAAERARVLDPANPARTALVAYLYGLSILGVTRMSNTGIPSGASSAEAEGPAARAALAALQQSHDADLLSAAGSVVATQGMMLARMTGLRPPAWNVDYEGLGEKFLQQAAAIDPVKHNADLGSFYAQKADRSASPEERLVLKKRAFGLESAAFANLADVNDIALKSFCMLALDVDEIAAARSCADRLLANAEKLKGGNMYGDSLNKAHALAGRVALRLGNLTSAKQHLLAAGDVPGDGTLTSFGPNMALAKELLEKGERDPVLQYLDQCAKFWPFGRKQLDAWRAAVQRGDIPNFGANLIY